MARKTLEVHGIKELNDALRELGEAAGQKGGPVKLALKWAADEILEEALRLVPISDDGSYSYTAKGGERVYFPPGRLRSSIVKRRHPNPIVMNEIYGVGVDPGTTRTDPRGAWYGHFMEKEYGLSGDRPQPFLRPAFDRKKTAAIEVYKKRLAAGILRIAKKVGAANAAKVAAQYK